MPAGTSPGLRSAKIRTLERTTVTIPNAEFAKLHLENLSSRDRMRLKERVSLSYETTPEQLQEKYDQLHG